MGTVRAQPWLTCLDKEQPVSSLVNLEHANAVFTLEHLPAEVT